VKDNLVLAVQEEGMFDFVDVVNFIGIAHYDTLPGLIKSYKTRLTTRAMQLAVADTNGFYFVAMSQAQADVYTLKVMDEKFLAGKITTDFIEYEADKFLVTVNEDKYIYLI
jgi:hypothetical protein